MKRIKRIKNIKRIENMKKIKNIKKIIILIIINKQLKVKSLIIS